MTDASREGQDIIDGVPGGFMSFGHVVRGLAGRSEIARSTAGSTESPIETIFGTAAREFLLGRYAGHPTTRYFHCLQHQEFDFDGPHVLLIPQYRWRRYRIDWVFKASLLEQPYAFVECDGAEFHSSAEDQERDRRKDAETQQAGIPLYRFTGSEIYRNARACAQLVFAGMERRYHEQNGAR